MDFKELIKFGLEESSEPIIKNPVLRDAMAEGGRIGFTLGGSSSVYDNLTPEMKKFYKETTGKKWNKKDWNEGNYRKTNKSRKAKDVVKKPQKMSPYYRKVEFFNQFKKNQRMSAAEAKLEKQGYISARKLNSLLGRKKTSDAIDDLKGQIKDSAWLGEKDGVSRWKRSKNFSFIDSSIGGQRFYKLPNERTINSMKDYYKNQEFLSEAKYGRIKDPSIQGARAFYEDKDLLKAIKQWSGNTKEIDKNALKVLNSVFGSDNWKGPNAIKNLGRALSGEIKIEGIKVDKVLGKKILNGMTRTANSKYGGSTWDQAAYQYAKDSMETLFKNKGNKTFKQFYDDADKMLRDVLGKQRGKVAIDEIVSLRTGLTNDSQVYSVFSQVIDKKINEKTKKNYDALLSRTVRDVREELAKGPEANLDKIKKWTDDQNKRYAKAKKKDPGVNFANMGEFNYETGKFSKPKEVFGERFKELPSDIRKGINESFRRTGVSLNVGEARTQKELSENIKKVSPNIQDMKKKKVTQLLQKLGCGMYAGGRVGLKVGSGDCVNRAISKLKDSKNLSAAEKQLAKRIAGASGLKKLGGWAKAEGYFVLADMANNWTKGQSFQKGISEAVKTGTFGLIDMKGAEKDLDKVLKDQNLSKEEMQGVHDWMDYAQKEGKLQKGITTENLMHEDVGEYDDSGMWGEAAIPVTSQASADAYTKKVDELERLRDEAGEKADWKGYNAFNKGIEALIAKERNKTAGTIFDRGYRKSIGAKGDEGMIWGPTFGNLFREGMEAAGFEENKALKKFTPQKVINYHPVYGYKEDIKDVIRQGDSPMEDVLYQFEKYMPSSALQDEALYNDPMGTYEYDPYLGNRQYQAGGGIAGIRRPSAIPPESGPTPYGLPSMLNRVKKV